MTVIWCMVPEIWSAMERIFCQFGPFLCPFTPSPNNLKNQNVGKMKKRTGAIIILQMCTTNDIDGSWGMECDRQNSLSFWTIFCTFTPPPLTTCKIKILKKWKNQLEILSLYMCTINDNHITYGSWDIKHDRQNFLSF